MKRIFDKIYLGIHLDLKLTWKNHTDSAIDKGCLRCRLMKHLTSVTWGSTQDISCAAYKSYVRLVIEYGNEVDNCLRFY